MLALHESSAIAIAAAPLLAYLRKSEEVSASTGKIVHNGRPLDEWGEMLPVRASFRHAIRR